MMFAASILLVVVCLCCQGSGVVVMVDPHAEECFFDAVKVGESMVLAFEVAEGGFLDIDVKFTDPNGQDIYNKERVTDELVRVKAEYDGRYTFCFSNKMSTLTPKKVVFGFSTSSSEAPGSDINNMIRTLGDGLTAVARGQEFMEVRQSVHHWINVRTNQRVVVWAIFEALLLLAICFGQLYYWKRFFEVRRLV